MAGRLILAFVTLLVTFGVQAQDRDRKDWLIDAVQAQRDDGLAKLAICYADSNVKIIDLQKQSAAKIAEMQKEIDALKAEAEKRAKPAEEQK